jgi:hypothetical protein
MSKSKERAHLIIAHHTEAIKNLNGIIKSVILVGSLSDNSYTGNAGSDIDLIHILYSDASADSKNIVYDLITKTEEETNKDIPISKCIYFYDNLFPPYKTDFELHDKNKDMVELPIEIFRIKESGKTLYGDEIINEIPMPAKNDVLLFREISERWNKSIAEQNPERHKIYLQTVSNPPVRLIVQSVLTGAMTHYYFFTNESCSSKAQIYYKVKKSIPSYRFLKLLELSHKWRFDFDSITDDDTAYMISEYKTWYEIKSKSSFDFVPVDK